MPLDLSGFVTPGQKFEGLQQIGEDIQKSNLYQQKLDASAAKKNKDYFGAISPFIELKQYDTDRIYNKQVADKVSEMKTKGMQMFAAGKTEDEVKFELENDRNQLLGYKNNINAIKDAEKLIDKKAENNPGFDAATAKLNLRKKMFFNDDGTQKTMDQVPADFEQVVGEVLTGPGVYNRIGFNTLISSGKGNVSEKTVVKRTDKTGKSTTQEIITNAPKGFILEEDDKGNDQWVPEYEKITLVDANNAPREDVASLMNEMLGNNKGNSVEVRAIPNDTYRAYQGIDGITGYLNSKAKEFEQQAKAKGIQVTPDDIENFKKAVAYNELDLSQNIVGKFTKGNIDVKKETPIHIHTPRQKTESQEKYDFLKNTLHKALDEEPLNPDGSIDISEQFRGLKYKNTKGSAFDKSVGSTGVITYNPTTKKVYISIEGKAPETISFDKFYSGLSTENEQGDMNKIKALGEYRRKGKYNKK